MPSSTNQRPTPTPGPSVTHLYDCTHEPCRCPTAQALLAVFSDEELVADCRRRGLVNEPPPPPVLVSTTFSVCVIHQALGHDDGRAWNDCRFRQLFYFENPMDEHTLVTYLAPGRRLLTGGPDDGPKEPVR